MAPILTVLKTGATLPEIARRRGDFEDWIREGMGLPTREVRVVPVYEGAQLPSPDEVAAVAVTGSSAMVTSREPWSVRSAAWLRELWEREHPILGICYGHQLLADALGGKVAANPTGREIGTVAVRRTEEGREDPLFSVLDDHFEVQQTHSEAVVELPPGATLLATNEAIEHQAFAVGSAWGVQFHPEFDADVVRGYVTARREAMAKEGLDPDGVFSAVHDTGAGGVLLRRFVELARGRS